MKVVVTGLGVSGPPVVSALLAQGSEVTVVDDRATPEVERKAEELRKLGVEIVLGPWSLDPETELIITSPGWKPTHPLLSQAATAGVEIIGDVEFAWRLDQERTRTEGTQGPIWLTLTGTNGKTTAVGMLASMLNAAGKRAAAAGNVGYSIVSAVLSEPRYEVLAVELSSFQLHWASTLRPHAGAVINIAEDHLDWHGSFAAYRSAKEKLLELSDIAIVNQDDLESSTCAPHHSHRIGITRDIPRLHEVGVVEDFLVDRAFSDPAVELATFADISPFAPHNITNALVAGTLARSIDLDPTAIAQGLRSYTSDGHRIATIATIDGVRYVNDSKATNPHAALAALSAFENVIWIAGGLAKGAAMDDLVIEAGHRIKAALLIGADRHLLAEAFQRHAPQVHVELIDPSDTTNVGRSVMEECVTAARRLAESGDVVLLAPACASMDQFKSYAERGDWFIEAVVR